MKKLWTQIGLIQTAMAKLIGNNKTTGSLHEKGLHELNAKALSMLSTLEILMGHSAGIHSTEKISLNVQKALGTLLKKLVYDQKRAAQQHELFGKNARAWKNLCQQPQTLAFA
ncbi:hypothetical protein GJU39_21995 [Pedobacter petrophilus]|uniref:Uncharacterized protein n=1 Tax=Pedobacter petrophilus TaxID=1908241 RepID=A0A7K0G4M2_9SPHI|nr:hypothetical protein [Pedobacter petrophilus]MRX78753.1 hypothetical protein [Pedobacter petrophilus]